MSTQPMPPMPLVLDCPGRQPGPLILTGRIAVPIPNRATQGPLR